jgi:hypothetical protein
MFSVMFNLGARKSTTPTILITQNSFRTGKVPGESTAAVESYQVMGLIHLPNLLVKVLIDN